MANVHTVSNANGVTMNAALSSSAADLSNGVASSPDVSRRLNGSTEKAAPPPSTPPTPPPAPTSAPVSHAPPATANTAVFDSDGEVDIVSIWTPSDIPYLREQLQAYDTLEKQRLLSGDRELNEISKRIHEAEATIKQLKPKLDHIRLKRREELLMITFQRMAYNHHIQKQQHDAATAAASASGTPLPPNKRARTGQK